ncbi:MAG: hypothetical protein Q8Q89_03020 [bacterium]|nr:hypothetical protein [bacterium]
MTFLKQNWMEFGLVILVLGALFFIKGEGTSPNPALISDVASLSPTPMTTEEPVCDNYKDIQTFEKPVSIIWTAKLDGCLESCYGASFTRVLSDTKYPRFAGYYPDISGKYDWDVASNGERGGDQIPDKFLEDGLILKIYGKWTDIDADHPLTVFENKCVPIVEIEKIEIKK